MTVHIDLPALGEDVTQAQIIRWLKHIGDTVEADEPLLEVATDKVDTEIPAPIAGTLIAILAGENATVVVGSPIATIQPTTAPAPTPAEPTPAPAPAAAPAPVPTPGDPAPPPAASNREQDPVQEPSGTATASRTEKMSRLRQTIATRMIDSLRVSPQLTTVVEVDVTRLAQLRNRAKDAFLTRTGTKLSFVPFFAKAAVEALAEHPMLNASVSTDNREVTYYRPRHLGIAVDTPRGLLVPVIRDAGELSIEGLALAIADLADRARTGKIIPDQLTGATFTLTNTGSRGALFDTPIINQPQTGILGTGAVVDRVIPQPDPDGGHTLAVRSMAYLSISYDHRIVDGADAARYLTTVKNRLEQADFDTDL